MKSLSDEELVAKFRVTGQDGGAVYADILFQRHYARVALWCFRLAGDRDRASDLAQEVFVRAWANLLHFRGDSQFTTWLYMVTRNHCFNALKREGKHGRDWQPMSDSEEASFGAEPAGFDRELERREMLDAARRIMSEELTPLESQVMTLHFADEVPLPVISRLLQLENASGAKAYVVSAKRKLKDAVARWGERPKRGNAAVGEKRSDGAVGSDANNGKP